MNQTVGCPSTVPPDGAEGYPKGVYEMTDDGMLLLTKPDHWVEVPPKEAQHGEANLG